MPSCWVALAVTLMSLDAHAGFFSRYTGVGTTTGQTRTFWGLIKGAHQDPQQDQKRQADQARINEQIRLGQSRVSAVKADQRAGGASAKSPAYIGPGAGPVSGATQVTLTSAPKVKLIENNDPRLSDPVLKGFKSMGRMYEFQGPNGSLILSGVAQKKMIYEDAVAYCASKGARLPSKAEYIALSVAMGSAQPDFDATGFDMGKYNQNLISHMRNGAFWTGTKVPHIDVDAFVLLCNNGAVDHYDELAEVSVRCVVSSK